MNGVFSKLDAPTSQNPAVFWASIFENKRLVRCAAITQMSKGSAAPNRGEARLDGRALDAAIRFYRPMLALPGCTA
jgi:hypothetical protein